LGGAAGAGGALTWLNGMPERTAPAAEPVFVTLEPFTLNVASDSGRQQRYLHVGMSVKATDTESGHEITQNLPEVRSRVLMLLSGKTLEQLDGVEHKTQLASEIQNVLAQPFAPGARAPGISAVMFTAFVLQ
jgi:flagellar protein FliL